MPCGFAGVGSISPASTKRCFPVRLFLQATKKPAEAGFFVGVVQRLG
jgi:hypothetical protein